MMMMMKQRLLLWHGIAAVVVVAVLRLKWIERPRTIAVRMAGREGEDGCYGLSHRRCHRGDRRVPLPMLLSKVVAESNRVVVMVEVVMRKGNREERWRNSSDGEGGAGLVVRRGDASGCPRQAGMRHRRAASHVRW